MMSEVSTLGLLNVATYLKERGYCCNMIYLPKYTEENEREVEAILSFIREESPDLIGFSLMTFHFNRARRLTERIKATFLDILILWGGVHPTFNPEESIQYADYVCVGEGEDATFDLVHALDRGFRTDNILNIWCKKDGRVTKNNLRPLIQNLDDYPFPRIDWDKTFCLDEEEIKPLTHRLYRKYVQYNGTTYDVMISRGCPYACSYCCNGLFKELYAGKGTYVRYRSVDNVIEELEYMQKEFPYVRIVNIQDDGFAATLEPYLREFSQKYRLKISLPLRLRIIPTMMTEEKMSYLSKANTLVGVMGLQSSDRVNREVFNRFSPSEKFIETAKLMHKYSIVGQFDVIIKNPFETEKDAVEKCLILSQVPKPFYLELFSWGFSRIRLYGRRLLRWEYPSIQMMDTRPLTAITQSSTLIFLRYLKPLRILPASWLNYSSRRGETG